MPTARCAPPPAGSGTPTTAGDHAPDVTDGQDAPIADSAHIARRRIVVRELHRTCLYGVSLRSSDRHVRGVVFRQIRFPDPGAVP